MVGHLREDHHEFLEIHYFTPSSFEKAGAAWPIRLGRNIAKPNYHIGPRTSPYYYLIFVQDGHGTFIQNGRTYPLRPNDMFCLFPQVTHEYFTDAEKPLRKIFFAFDGKLALQLLERIGLRPQNPHAPSSLTPEILALMEQFIEVLHHGEPSERESSDLTRLAYILRVFDALSACRAAEMLETAPPSSWLQKGTEYMEIHYADGISIGQVAEYAGVDRTHFTKQFRKAYGVTPIQFLQQLRMNEARLLLAQTSYKIAEIAQSVGYPDLFTFSKAFKKLVGLSPNAYRGQPGEE
ncbi:AraC family transcriptional regulator [Paenibacillus sp. R14(2021)]|uniref:helix-turn-helix transcriptional regulator n=1 Tax=Paenibacillus sp. R14(2021) TaxID=2859228 RepID=UPI001C614354|nr:AraC family transcriptional regulator [Paenibacillus sp. R14(2021)]